MLRGALAPGSTLAAQRTAGTKEISVARIGSPKKLYKIGVNFKDPKMKKGSDLSEP